MRVPYYLAQYNHTPPVASTAKSAILPVIVAGGVLLYVGILAAILLSGWA